MVSIGRLADARHLPKDLPSIPCGVKTAGPLARPDRLNEVALTEDNQIAGSTSVATALIGWQLIEVMYVTDWEREFAQVRHEISSVVNPGQLQVRAFLR
jgi:hypothetical protein